MDRLSPDDRSRLMGRIRGKDTKPEVAVRRLLFSLGYRYRLHRKGLPGRPDIVFPGRRKVIFVHGCFWHGHPGCLYAAKPATRAEFWRNKIDAARKRDASALKSLAQQGWKTLVVWECQLRDGLHHILYNFLDGSTCTTISTR